MDRIQLQNEGLCHFACELTVMLLGQVLGHDSFCVGHSDSKVVLIKQRSHIKSLFVNMLHRI